MNAFTALFSPTNGTLDPSLFPGLAAFFAAFVLLIIIIGIAVYVYTSLAWMSIAKKTKTHPTWLAWIPVANLYQRSKIARMHWWPILLIIVGMIPIIGFFASIALMVFLIIWNWKAFERVHRPGWWALFLIIPIIGWVVYLILLGIVAWGNN